MNQIARTKDAGLKTVEKYYLSLLNMTLIPSEQVLHVCCKELEASLQVANPKDAARWAKIMVAAYPNSNVADPDNYALHITSEFAKCPLSLCPKVVKEITRVCKRLPSRAQVFAIIKQLADHREMLLKNARIMIDHHLAIKEESARKERQEKMLKDHQEKYGCSFWNSLRKNCPKVLASLNKQENT